MDNTQRINEILLSILVCTLALAFVVAMIGLFSELFAYKTWRNVFAYSKETAFFIFLGYASWTSTGLILLAKIIFRPENSYFPLKIQIAFVKWIFIIYFASIFICIIFNILAEIPWNTYRSYPQVTGTWPSFENLDEESGLGVLPRHLTKNQPIIKDIFTDEIYLAEEQDPSIVQQLMDSDGISIKWDDSISAYANNVYLMQLTIKKSIFGRNIIASSEDQPFKNLPLKVQIYVITKLKQSETHENVLRDLVKDFPVANCMSKPNANANNCM